MKQLDLSISYSHHLHFGGLLWTRHARCALTACLLASCHLQEFFLRDASAMQTKVQLSSDDWDISSKSTPLMWNEAQRQTSCRLAPIAVIWRNGGMSKVFFSNSEKRVRWYPISLCPIFFELSIFWMSILCQRCGGLQAVARFSTVPWSEHQAYRRAPGRSCFFTVAGCCQIGDIASRVGSGMKAGQCASARSNSYSSCKKR